MKLKKYKNLALTTSDSYFGDTSKSLFFAGGEKYKIASSLLLYASPLGVTGRFAGEPLTDTEGLECGNFTFGGNSSHFKCKTDTAVKSDAIYILTALEDARLYGVLTMYINEADTPHTATLPITTEADFQAVQASLRRFYRTGRAAIAACEPPALPSDDGDADECIITFNI